MLENDLKLELQLNLKTKLSERVSPSETWEMKKSSHNGENCIALIRVS